MATTEAPGRSGSGRAVAVAAAVLVLGGIALIVVGGGDVPPPGSGAPGSGSGSASGSAATLPPRSAASAQAFEEQVAALREHLETTPDDPTILLWLARLLQDGHRPEEAVPYYARALELGVTDSDVVYDLASAYVELRDWDAAEALLRERLEAIPGDAVALYNLGAVRANRGDEMGARGLWEEAWNATADGELQARIRDSLGQLGGAGGG